MLARLKVESDKIREDFGILIDKTRESLMNKGKSCQDLKALIKYSNKNRLYNLFEEEVEITNLFIKLSDHWSFFDYELIDLIIRRHCPELVDEMKAYKSALKTYCLRRVVEVPADAFKMEDADETRLFVKCDKSFEKIILEDIKDLESRLSALLDTDLYLLKVDDGCTELVFDTMCPIPALTKSQRSLLSEMGIEKLYSVHYQSTKSLPSNSPPPIEKVAMGTPSGKQSFTSGQISVSVQTDEPSSKRIEHSSASTQTLPPFVPPSQPEHSSASLQITLAQDEPPSQPAQAVPAEFELSKDDFKLIAKEIEKADKVEELAEVLKMTSHLKEINGNGKRLLEMWQRVAASRDLLQRPHLMYYLEVIGLGHLHARYMYVAIRT